MGIVYGYYYCSKYQIKQKPEYSQQEVLKYQKYCAKVQSEYHVENFLYNKNTTSEYKVFELTDTYQYWCFLVTFFEKDANDLQ